VTLEVMAKKVDPANADIAIFADRVTVTVTHPDDPMDPAPYVLDIELFGGVVVEDSAGSVLGTKLEIRLKKVESIQWSDITAAARKAAVVTQPLNFSDPEMQRAAYPSSKAAQMKKPTDWDKLEADLTAEDESDKLEVNPALCTPHSIPWRLHPTLYTLEATPITLHPGGYTPHRTPHILHPPPFTLQPTAHSPQSTPHTLHPHSHPTSHT
jgi:hypothetical protein